MSIKKLYRNRGVKMNLLPDMIIIDFCEWLNSVLSKRRDQHDLDFYDLMLDRENSFVLERYAEEYLHFQINRSQIIKLLHRFIDSEEFDQYVDIELNKYFPREYSRLSDIVDYLSSPYIEKYFDLFIFKTYGVHSDQLKLKDIGLHLSGKEHNITPEQLAGSAYYVFSKSKDNPQIARDKQWVLQLMNHAELDIGIEADFLEWLIQIDGEPIDFRNMPLRTFELLAQKFQNECGKSEREKKKLIRSFKQMNILVLSEKLTNRLPLNTVKRAKDLGYIVKRYNDHDVKFKCFIVPLQADSAEYIELMEKRWYDLHYLSGDYLDIYYSKADYGCSGFEITRKMNYIPESLKTKAPLIVLWENDLNKACGIDISNLDNDAIFKVIRCIVNLIRDKNSLEMIVQEANQMCKELRDEQRDKQRPVTHNVVTIQDNATVNGPVAAENSGNMVFQSEERTRDADVLHDLESAKQIINNFSDINDRQKELLMEIIDEAKNAIRENSTDQKDKSKKRFKDAVDLIGVGSKLISALSGLTTVLGFFGISPV